MAQRLRGMSVRHSWRLFALIAIAVITLGAIAYGAQALYELATRPAVQQPAAPRVVENVQVEVPATDPQANLPVAPTLPMVEVEWVEVGKASLGQQVDLLPMIPYEKLSGVSGIEAAEELQYPFLNRYGFASAHGKGDGTAFLLETGRTSVFKFHVTPDQGENWFEVNLPAGPVLGGDKPGAYGALVEGESLVLFSRTQHEPWAYTYWRAEIPLATLEATNPQVNLPVTPTLPLVEVEWVEIGRKALGEEALIPAKSWAKSVGAYEAGAELNYPFLNSRGIANGGARGDGTVFLFEAGVSHSLTFHFTPNRGGSWYTVRNLPPGATVEPTAEVLGALLEGETLVLYSMTQYEPWKYIYWRAEIPLATLEGLHP